MSIHKFNRADSLAADSIRKVNIKKRATAEKGLAFDNQFDDEQKKMIAEVRDSDPKLKSEHEKLVKDSKADTTRAGAFNEVAKMKIKKKGSKK